MTAACGKKVIRDCARCKLPFLAREADVKRGWGRFCSKSCKAINQEQKTGQHRAYVEHQQQMSGTWCGHPDMSEGGVQ